MTRDDAQLSLLCRAILGPELAERMGWTDRPGKVACQYFEADGGPLSSGERVLLLTAFAFWNSLRNRKATVADLFGLDRENLTRVARALHAYAGGPEAVHLLLCELEGEAEEARRP